VQAHAELESARLQSSSLEHQLSTQSSRAMRAENELVSLKSVELELQDAQIGLSKHAKSVSKKGEQVASLKDKLASMHRVLHQAEVEKNQLHDEYMSISKRYKVPSYLLLHRKVNVITQE
jgi:chromosome segregation ATPase